MAQWQWKRISLHASHILVAVVLLSNSQEVKSLEKACRWRDAADACKRLFSITQDQSQRAEILREIGFCLRRAATQSSTLSDFRETMKEAEDFYFRSSSEYESVPGRQGEASDCRGAGLICESLTEEDPMARRRILNEALAKELEAFNIFSKEHNIAAAASTCSSLLESVVGLIDLEHDPKTKQALVEEGLWASEACFGLDSLAKVQDEVLAVLYNRSSSLRCRAAWLLPDATERKASVVKSIQDGRKSVEHALATGNDYNLALSHIYLGWYLDVLEGKIAEGAALVQEALTFASRARDRSLIGGAHCYLSSASYWRMTRGEEYESIADKGGVCEGHARNAIENSMTVDTIVGHALVTAWSYGSLADCYEYLARVQTDYQTRMNLLNRAAEMGRRAVEEAHRSDSDIEIVGVLHSLSKVLFFQATHIEDRFKKSTVLQEALKARRECVERAFRCYPFYYWDVGVFHAYLALIIQELSETDRSLELLSEAERTMKECLELCRRYLSEVSDDQEFYTPMSWYLSWYGDILSRLNSRDRQQSYVEKAVQAFDEAAALCASLGELGTVARMRWKAASVLQDSGQLSKAADIYQDASKSFELAAGKSPKLAQIYLEYSALMKAQSEAQKAKLADLEREDDKAAQLFIKASKILETSSRWQMLSPFYQALSEAEHAEASSKAEELEKASQQFQQARKMLLEVSESIQKTLTVEKPQDELATMRRMNDDIEFTAKYCLARQELEDGRSMTRTQTRSKGRERFQKARLLFEELVASPISEAERDQLQILALSCRAEESLARGDETADPNAYAEASRIFQEIRDRSHTKRVRMLALGHQSYSKALENGAKYLAGLGPKFFDEAKGNIERAINAYDESGSRRSSNLAEATRLYLDAHAYVDKAETSLNIPERLTFYGRAETCLVESANLFQDVRYPTKKDEVAKSLKRVRKHTRFTISLGDISFPTTPPVEVSVPAFHEVRSMPSPKELERPNIQGRVNVASEAETGKGLEIQFDLVNVGSTSAILVKLEKAFPKAWRAALPSDDYQLVDGSLNLRARKLNPLQAETINLVAQTSEPGSFEFVPRVVFIDDVGKLRTQDLDAAHVTVLAPLELDLEIPQSRKVFHSLLEAFVKDYRDRALFVDKAGWRTMIEITRAAAVSRSALYGTRGRMGPALSELRRKGLAEVRIFPGERGRGGRIMRARVDPANLKVQAHLRQAGVKNPEK